MKSKQTSIRFNPERLEFIKEREKIKTDQKVVEFLVDQYWWQNRLNLSPQTTQKAINGSKSLTEYETLENDIKQGDSLPILDITKRSILQSKTLDQLSKRALMELAAEKILKLKNQ